MHLSPPLVPLSETSIFEQLESEVRTYCRSFPAVFRRAKGAELYDESGRRYIDFFCGAATLNYGHNNDAIKAALVDYLMRDEIIHALDCHTSGKRSFLERFAEIILVPRRLDYKVQFCGPTGTNAVEAALKLARKVTGRTGVFAFSGAFHGMSMGSLSVSSGWTTRAAAGVPLAHTTFFPYPAGPQGAFDTLELLARTLEDPYSGVEPPAAVILETVQLEGGVYAASREFLIGLRELTQRHGILMIIDDIQIGCGRSGKFFSFEQAGIVPDLVTLSKSISGYGMPMALLLMRRDLDRWQPGEHTGTFRGFQLALVAASAALDFWRDDHLESAVASHSNSMFTMLQGTLEARESDVAVRGRGLALGIDFTHAGGPARAQRVQQDCFTRGLIVERCGRRDEVVKVLPPLTIEPALLAEGCNILLDSIRHS